MNLSTTTTASPTPAARARWQLLGGDRFYIAARWAVVVLLGLVATLLAEQRLWPISSGMQPILLLAESLVLSAADGYAKASGKTAFVNVHLAAGTRQGSGQLQNAYFDGSPMVVTAAMRDTGTFGDHNTLGASAGFSQMGAVQDITKKRWEVIDARGIPMATRRAFKEAMTMPTGPVSSPASIFITQTPLSASPAMIARWIGAAPRQRGSSEA